MTESGADTITNTITNTVDSKVAMGQLPNGAQVRAVRGPEGWGIAVEAPGRASAHQDQLVRAELWDGAEVKTYACGYDTLTNEGKTFLGRARLALGGAALEVQDRWSVQGGALWLVRNVRVEGAASGGFLTSVALELRTPLTWPDVDAFAPGVLYGWDAPVSPRAIGSVAHYIAGVRAVRVREDRLPAPLFGLALRDGTSLTVLNPAPRGDTTLEDSLDVEGAPLTDARFAFAALGGEERDGRMALGLSFPGTEGEVTYLADTPFVEGQFGDNVRRHPRGRYHPLEDGFEQRYEAAFRFGNFEREGAFRRDAWRWAWSILKPQVVPQDLAAARGALGEVLEASIQKFDNRAGPAHLMDPRDGRFVGAAALSAAHGGESANEEAYNVHAAMGFTGRAIKTGELLLRSSGLTNEAATRRREWALAVLETFARLPVSPPQAEGLELRSGRLTSGVRSDFYLRPLAEGGAAMLRAYEGELGRGEAHPHWLAWCASLADWLLTQEESSGGFPRSWRDHTAKIVSDDPRSSLAAVPFLVQLAHVTQEEAYLQAALRAGELCWALGGSRGTFVGGTLDNANVVDQEAGSLALEAHLALFEATLDGRWLERAEAAADFAETWTYIWNVPMPEDAADAGLHWKGGVTTVGSQVITTGHSLTGVYMAWDVASYAKLYTHTHDAHYLDVAKLLLHNTKGMLALPGRTFDLAGPGWQQEHWSFAPPRGRGVHRFWLPWVACSHLESIDGLEGFAPELSRELMVGAPFQPQGQP